MAALGDPAGLTARKSLLPRAAQPGVPRPGRGVGAETETLRHFDDLVEKRLITEPRIWVGRGIFRGGDAVKRREKHRPGHLARMLHRRFDRELALVIRRRGDADAPQHRGLAPLVLRGIAGIRRPRIDPLDRGAIMDIGSHGSCWDLAGDMLEKRPPRKARSSNGQPMARPPPGAG